MSIQHRRLLVISLASLCVGVVLPGPARAQVGDPAERDLSFAQGLYAQENYALAADKFVAFVRQYPTHANLSLALFRAGECLYRTAKYPEAEAQFSQLIRQFPDSAEAEPGGVWLGDAAFQAKHYQQAADAYAAFLQKHPASDQAGHAAYWQGESYYHLGRNPEALAAYQLALTHKLSDQEAAYTRYAVGWTYLQLNQPDKALDCLQQVLDKYPASPVAAESQYLLGNAHRARKDWPAALAAYQKVLAAYAGSKFAPLAQAGIAWCHFDQKAYEPALEAFRRVVATYPGSAPAAEAELRAADCLFHLKRWAEAAPAYEKVSADRAGKWADEATYWLAVTYEQMPDAARAVAAHTRLATEFRQSPRLPEALLHLGRLQAAAGRLDEALAAYKAALETAQDPALKQQAQAGLAWVVYQKDQSGQSLAEVEKLVRQDPKAPGAAELGVQVAAAHFNAGRLQPALDLLELLLAAQPAGLKLGQALYLAGACHEGLGHDQKAEEFYRRVLQEGKQPEYTAPATASLVGLYARAGDLARARALADDLQRSAASPEAKAFALNAVADALAKAKQPAEALPLYSRALELAPEGPTAPFAQLGVAWSKLAANDPSAAEAFWAVARKYPGSPAAKRVPEGLLAAAEALYGQGKFPEAQGLYQRVLEGFPDSKLVGGAEYKLAWCLLKQGKPEAALPHFTAAVPKVTQPAVVADARYQAARLLADKGSFAPAAELLEPLRQQYQDPDRTPLALALLGRVCLELGQPDKAAPAFQLVLDRYPQSPAVAEAWLGLGRILRQQKNYDQAQAALAKCLASASGAVGAEAQYELGACLRDRGDAKKAVEELLKVAILFGDAHWSARAQWEAGQCYEQLQDTAGAIATYKVVLRDYPTQQPWADQARARLQALQPPG